VNGDLEGCGRGLILRYYPDICLEELRQITKNLSHYSLSPGRELNLGPPEYGVRVVTTRVKMGVDVTGSGSFSMASFEMWS
jgi:hypothetical protein